MWKYFNLRFHRIWSYLDLVRPIYACILENWVFIVLNHYDDVTMSLMASQITSLTIVYPTVYSGADQREHQSSASLAIVRGIHRGPVNSPHKWPVTRKMFPFDDVIMITVCRSSRAIFHENHWWIANNAHKNGIQLWVYQNTEYLKEAEHGAWCDHWRHLAKDHLNCINDKFR